MLCQCAFLDTRQTALSSKSLFFLSQEFDAYCTKVERPSFWGGQLELRAMSTALKSNIVVVQADGADVVLGQFCAPPLIVAFHR